MGRVPPGGWSGFAISRRGRRAGHAASLALLCLLGACAGGGGGGGARSGDYGAPGPASDPWGPYIQEAAQRFQIPDTWIRAVMHQESGGHQYLGGQLTTSSAGATGLMQVMPATYAGLAQRYGLGGDPYDPHDNIMAGAGYLREMYDKYGSPRLLLAAYNAGPRRVDDYLASGRSLPTETVNYVAAITPNMNGRAGPATAQYAVAMARIPNPTVVDRMEPIASPGDPGVPLPAAPVEMARMEPIASPGDPGVMAPIASPGDPGIPAIVAAVAKAPLGTPVANLPARPQTAFTQYQSGQYQNGQYRDGGGRLRSPPPGVLHLPATRAAAPAPMAAAIPAIAVGGRGGRYAIQVGAYASPAEARSAAEAARGAAGTEAARPELGTARRPDGSVLFRARLVGMSSGEAAGACQRLQASGRSCFVVPPDGTS
jgi:hypothetical protein